MQVNARKIYDEADVICGITQNKLFSAILIGEATLQVLLNLRTLFACCSKHRARTWPRELALSSVESDVTIDAAHSLLLWMPWR